MEVFTLLVSNCVAQEYCTNCPSRKVCILRYNFYSEEKFMEKLKIANFVTAYHAIHAGHDFYSIAVGVNDAFNAFKKKRSQELKEHPTYSPD